MFNFKSNSYLGKVSFLFIAVIIGINPLLIAQKRYQSVQFTTIDSLIDITYGSAINLKGEREQLLLNIFSPPSMDTFKQRPLVIFIHGGGFRNNNKSSSISNKLGVRLGMKGYVVASIDYRLGIEKTNTVN